MPIVNMPKNISTELAEGMRRHWEYLDITRPPHLTGKPRVLMMTI